MITNSAALPLPASSSIGSYSSFRVTGTPRGPEAGNTARGPSDPGFTAAREGTLNTCKKRRCCAPTRPAPTWGVLASRNHCIDQDGTVQAVQAEQAGVVLAAGVVRRRRPKDPKHGGAALGCSPPLPPSLGADRGAGRRVSRHGFGALRPLAVLPPSRAATTGSGSRKGNTGNWRVPSRTSGQGTDRYE